MNHHENWRILLIDLFAQVFYSPSKLQWKSQQGSASTQKQRTNDQWRLPFLYKENIHMQLQPGLTSWGQNISILISSKFQFLRLDDSLEIKMSNLWILLNKFLNDEFDRKIEFTVIDLNIRTLLLNRYTRILGGNPSQTEY